MTRTPRLLGSLLLTVLSAATFLCAPALAREDASAAIAHADADADGAVVVLDADGEPSLAVKELDRTTENVIALTAGNLAPAVDPATLFPLSLDDDEAVRIDAARLRALLADLEASVATDTTRTTGTTGTRERSGHHAERTSRKEREADAEIDADIDAARWSARLSLDRARLAFYELPAARRTALVATHRQRIADLAAQQDAARSPQASDEDRQAQDSLRAAETARSRAERSVADEVTRLIGIEHAQADFADTLAHAKDAIAERREITLGWQQRALDARQLGGASADRLYEDLRRALRTARDDLSTSLDQLNKAPTEVPAAGKDPLAELRIDVDVRAARAERDKVEAETRRLASEDLTLRQDRAAQLFDEVDTLNRERLELLGALTPEKRHDVTGFTAAGWSQAASELRQLTLILRYHAFVIEQWVPTLRHPGTALGVGIVGSAFDVFKWLLLLGGFVWWRRRSAPILRAWRLHAHAEDRLAGRSTASPTTRVLVFLEQIHKPAEWLAFLFLVGRLLPPATAGVLEVRVASALLSWIFGAALVVDTLNALAGSSSSRRTNGPRSPANELDSKDTSELRLQSLRLVARVVVVLALILIISSMLVGHGTIYDWVDSTCWLASIPVLLVLVRRWRSVVFERTLGVRKPPPVQRWVLAHRQGWTSFVAASVGGAYLFVSGAIRGARAWIGRFDLTRRALAYLFRRQLGKMGDHAHATGPIAAEAFAALGPDAPLETPIATDADDALDRIASRIRAREGGMIAIVGERGIGKTTALRRLLGGHADTLFLEAKPAGLDALRAALASSLNAPPDASFEACAARLEASDALHALVIEDAHHFIQPIMGGLASFDALLAVAANHARATTYVFVIDLVVWQFLERARGARPLFDDVVRLGPWREENIVALLEGRTASAGLSPTFEHLLERLPANADDIDRHEALVQRAADYYRLLWDYAAGNPGVALHMWRRSLGVDANGTTAVRLFAALDTSDLERLPDSTVFVLRAVLQMEGLPVEIIGHATLLRPSEMADAVRYAVARGYIEESRTGYRITWTWFRAITQFLQRRHLLVSR